MMNVATEDSSLLNHEVASSFPQKKASSQILMRGSLPFKKRRFPSLGSFDEDKATEASPSLLSFNKAGDDRPPKTNQYSQGTDDKIAALALVAAAASEATSSAPEEGYSFAKTEPQFGNDNLNSTYGLSADLATAAADLQSLHDAKPDFETHAATNDESKRHTLSSNKAASAGSKGSNSSHHQDKRFTGAAGESRCQGRFLFLIVWDLGRQAFATYSEAWTMCN